MHVSYLVFGCFLASFMHEHAQYVRVTCMVLCTISKCPFSFTLILGFSDLLVIPVYDGNKRKVSQWHTEKLCTPYY